MRHQLHGLRLDLHPVDPDHHFFKSCLLTQVWDATVSA
jgi:hypothetical protein